MSTAIDVTVTRIVAGSSSVVSPRPASRYGAYIASKAAIEGLVRVLANELRGCPISINGVTPGSVKTDFFPEEKIDQLVQVPLAPDDIRAPARTL